MAYDISVKPPEPYQGHCDNHGEYTGTVSYILGRQLKSYCPKCSEERAAEEAKRSAESAAILKQYRISEKLGAAAIPLRFKHKSLSDYIAETDRQKHALSVCREYAENFSEHYRSGRCVMLMGLPGTGKTHLACGVANHLIREAGRTAVYRTVGGMLIEIKSSYDRSYDHSERQVMEGLTTPDLLVLDEIGATKPTEFELATLFSVINSRYEQQLPTMIASNLPPRELAGAIGDRCVDRLREGGGIVVGFDWDSKRGTL